MVLIPLNVTMIWAVEMLNVFSRLIIDGVKVVALAPVAMTMNGSTFHPRALMLLTSY